MGDLGVWNLGEWDLGVWDLDVVCGTWVWGT